MFRPQELLLLTPHTQMQYITFLPKSKTKLVTVIKLT